MTQQQFQRKYPIGVEYDKGEVDVRVWAPSASSGMNIIIGAKSFSLEPKDNGYFTGRFAAQPGDIYQFEINGARFADPASRFQPETFSGPSQVIDAASFKWTDKKWKGLKPEDHVLYEMHVGTFTKAGTFEAAREQLAELNNLGITTIELMPVADFPGDFGWGYDGVNQFAPACKYGRPEDLKSFIDTAHGLGMAVILDVVYNHIGPGGEEFFEAFSEDYFSKKHGTDWGKAINFDGDNREPVREYFTTNVIYWIEEYRFDGLRIDATQNIYDDTDSHILQEITAAAKAAGNGREIFIVMENESQNTRLIRATDQGGFGIDAAWNDDFHHAAVTAVTGHNLAYYTDYLGQPQEFISAAKYGYLYQGQYYDWQKNRRGQPGLDLKCHQFINFIENHDQIANSGLGLRLNAQTSPGRYRALSALMLLFPQLPLLFQGQEFASSKPFYYFADRSKDNACDTIDKGRKKELSQFRNLATSEMQAAMHAPCDVKTFTDSKLDFADREKNSTVYELYKDLLAIRNRNEIFRNPVHGLDGSVLSDEAFLLRYFTDDGRDWLLIVNFGRDLRKSPAPDPLLAPPIDCAWSLEWSSEHPKYGGSGTAALEGDFNWYVPGHAAVLLRSKKKD